MEPVTYETRFHILENLLVDVLSDLTQKLSQFSDAEVFFLVQSNSNGRRIAGSPNLCQAFLNKEFLPNGSEVSQAEVEERQPHNAASPEGVTVDASLSEAVVVAATAVPPPLIPTRKRISCTSIDDERPPLKVGRLSTAIKMENLESSAFVEAINAENISGIMMEESEEAAVGHLLGQFLNSSSKAEAIKQSSDPSIFSKSSVMYKLFSSLIWDYSKECAKVLPFDERAKPMLTSFAFDLLWNFFPAFEFYDNSPSINSGGCFRSPRGFFKNMFCNRLKDQTTRKKR